MKSFYLLVSMVIISNIINAQNIINEGRIEYDVFITSDLDQQKGKLIITIKNNMMKREMKMNNGYTNTILFNAITGQSNVYNDINSNKFSKNISKADVIIQNQKFVNAIYIEGKDAKLINEFKCKSVNITYADGNKNTVFYSEDYRVGIREFYSMFPDLKGIPLQYEVVTNSNKIILIAKSVQQTPIDAIEMEAPVGYKLLKK